MDDEPSTLTLVTLGIALWGALLSSYLAFARRRRRLRVSASFDAARLGDVRNHTFFVVRVVNVGERAATVREVEWETGPGTSFALAVFRHSKGSELPAKVEPDEELQVLFDPDHAAAAISRSEQGADAIRVVVSGARTTWRVPITDDMRAEAEELLELGREVAEEQEGP